jgi:hypothetical protein
VIRVKRFSVLLAVVAALAASTGTAARQVADPTCPIQIGYEAGSTRNQPASIEIWEANWAVFQRLVATVGVKYVTQAKPPSDAQRTQLMRLLPGELWKIFSIDRGVLRPGPKRKVVGRYLVEVTHGPCFRPETGEVAFIVRLTPRFKYPHTRLRVGPGRLLVRMLEGKVVQSYYLGS